MTTTGPAAVRVFDISPNSSDLHVPVQALEDAGYHVKQDTAPLGEVSSNDQIEIPQGRTTDDVRNALVALGPNPLPDGRPAFRPGPTASADIAERYLRNNYEDKLGAISQVVSAHASVSEALSPDRQRIGPSPSSQSYSYQERSAIELARGLAARLPPEELPLLRTAIARFVPEDTGGRYDESRHQSMLANRKAFIDAFRAELEVQPQYPR